MTWAVRYYKRPNGQYPVEAWLDTLPKKDQAAVLAKIEKLREEAITELLKTNMVKALRVDSEFYEVRSSNHRVAFYRNPTSGECILLWGFEKNRKSEPGEIEHARGLLHELLQGQ